MENFWFFCILIFIIIFILFIAFWFAKVLLLRYQSKSLLKMIKQLSCDAEDIVKFKEKDGIIYLFDKARYFFEARGDTHFYKYKKNGITHAGARIENLQFKLLYKKFKNIYTAYYQKDIDTLQHIKLINSCKELVI